MSARRPFEGRVAIVTGGSSGIGLATALALRGAGARVAIIARNQARLGLAAERLGLRESEDAGCILALSHDVEDTGAMQTMAAEVIDRWGRIDVLVHAAGVLRATVDRLTPFVDLPLAEWEAVLSTNLMGSFHATQAVLPSMVAAGEGEVLLVSSKSGRAGIAFDAPYCASKFALIGFAESLAAEVAPEGVRVQAIAPGAFETSLLEQAGTPRAELPPPARVADLILAMLALPREATLQHPVVESTASAPSWLRGDVRPPGDALGAHWTAQT